MGNGLEAHGASTLALVVAKHPRDGSVALLSIEHLGASSLWPLQRPLLVEPGSELDAARGQTTADVFRAALTAWDRSGSASQRILTVSSHGQANAFGPSARDQVNLAQLTDALRSMRHPPSLLAFDACQMGNDAVAAAAAAAGVRWLHGDSRPVSSQGYDYRDWFVAMARARRADGTLPMDSDRDVQSWFDPVTWQHVSRSPRMEYYSGSLFRASPA